MGQIKQSVAVVSRKESLIAVKETSSKEAVWNKV
jgi:hypothetical protein